MILQKQTFTKFGYWPKNLTSGSRRLVLRRCDVCRKIREIEYYNALKRTGCSECQRRGAVRKSSDVRIQRAENAKPIKITPKMWVELYESVSVIFNGNMRTPSLNKSGKIPLYGTQFKRAFGAEATCSILKGLGVHHSHISYTADFKEALLYFLKIQNNAFIFNVINESVTRRARWDKSSPNSLQLTVKGPALAKILDLWPDKYKYSQFTNGAMRIIKGSFFVDNEWVHIGL